MKYMLKRIFIGVAIGTILFIIKGGNVFAASTYIYNFPTKVANMSFDVCTNDNDNLMCINGFNKSLSLSSNSDSVRIYSYGSKIVALKSFDLFLETPNSDVQILRYGNLTSNLNSYFPTNQNSGHDINKLYANEFLSYVKIITQDNITCEINTNVGVNISRSYTPWAFLPSFEVPSECRGKYLKSIYLLWQKGYNYVGNDSIFDSLDFDSSYTNQNYVDKNKTNSYLLSWGNTEKLYTNLNISGNLSNTQLYFNSSQYYTSNSQIIQNYTLADEEINESLAQLEKEKYFASLGGTDLGPNMPSTENQEEVNNGLLDISTQIGTSLSTASFQDFLSALVQKPISELLWVVRSENVDAENKIIHCPTIYLPFKVNHTNNTSEYGMYLPCMSNIYSQIPYVMSYNYDGTYGLVTVYHIVLHGYLYYLLVLTWINLIKYTVTRSSSEIEVIEL